jgi:hypothetical protein
MNELDVLMESNPTIVLKRLELELQIWKTRLHTNTNIKSTKPPIINALLQRAVELGVGNRANILIKNC